MKKWLALLLVALMLPAAALADETVTANAVAQSGSVHQIIAPFSGVLKPFDWETGDEVERHQLSFDIYESGTNILWRGIHDPVSGQVVDYSDW